MDTKLIFDFCPEITEKEVEKLKYLELFFDRNKKTLNLFMSYTDKNYQTGYDILELAIPSLEIKKVFLIKESKQKVVSLGCLHLDIEGYYYSISEILEKAAEFIQYFPLMLESNEVKEKKMKRELLRKELRKLEELKGKKILYDSKLAVVEFASSSGDRMSIGYVEQQRYEIISALSSISDGKLQILPDNPQAPTETRKEETTITIDEEYKYDKYDGSY